MFDLFFALHLLTAIFAIGPLVHATTTANRGLRTGDVGAVRQAARTTTIYAYASVVVVLIGFGLMSMKEEGSSEPAGSFADLWIWLSAVLWLAAVGIALGIVVPALEKAVSTLGEGRSPAALVGRVAAAGGIVGLLFAVIVFLMVYKPGH